MHACIWFLIILIVFFHAQIGRNWGKSWLWFKLQSKRLSVLICWYNYNITWCSKINMGYYFKKHCKSDGFSGVEQGFKWVNLSHLSSVLIWCHLLTSILPLVSWRCKHCNFICIHVQYKRWVSNFDTHSILIFILSLFYCKTKIFSGCCNSCHVDFISS